MASLLLLSIGPIQDFIASARRCQDLWFGSWLLSDLARVTASAIAKSGATLVFPASDDAELDGKPSVANKILAIVPGGTAPAEVAECGKRAMRERLGEHYKAAFARIGDAKQFVHLDVARAQTDDLMELVWVSVPLATDRADYKAQRDRAEELLAARKNSRGWTAVPWGQAAGVPKSSLDGLRESVLDEKLFDDSPEAARARTRLFVKKGERLCGVGLLKRLGTEADVFAERRPAFHSTSHVASAPWRAALVAAGGADRTRSYVKFLQDLGVDCAGPKEAAAQTNPTAFPVPSALADNADGSLLYEGRLDERVQRSLLAKGKNKGESKAEVDRFRKMRGRLIASCGLGEPTPYYALLLADGDNMGVAIDAQASFENHKELGAALDAFSKRCKDTVEAHAGSLIYAGGDDVLALLPLHTALECARALALDFERALQAFGTPGTSPTLSVGLAVAHHVVDFAEVREQAKRAERLAKSHRGKNALGIIVEPRSGVSLEAVGSWTQDEHPSLDRRIVQWCELFAGEKLPDKVAFALSESVELLVPRKKQGAASAEEVELVSTAATTVVLGALARRRAGRGGSSVDAEVRKLVKEHFSHLLQRDLSSGPNDALVAVRALAQELQIARYFLEARALANRKPKDARHASDNAEVPS